MPVFSWVLQPAATVSTPTVSTSSSELPAASAQKKVNLLLPFRRDQKQDFATGSGWEAKRAALRLLLGTRYGELPYLPTYGSKLHFLKHRSQTLALNEIALFYCQEALSLWMPEILVEWVQADRDNNTLRLAIHFHITDLGGQIIASDLDENLNVAVPLAA